MSNITLKGQRVQELSFVSMLENGTKIELENKYSYNVNYGPNNICKGVMSVSVADKKDPKKFGIKAVIVGIFSFKEGVSKEVVHVESYKELFPYARALVTTVTANAGIPPIFLPGIDIESQSIYRFEKNPETGEDNLSEED